jgi:hypothetical protein
MVMNADAHGMQAAPQAPASGFVARLFSVVGYLATFTLLLILVALLVWALLVVLGRAREAWEALLIGCA